VTTAPWNISVLEMGGMEFFQEKSLQAARVEYRWVVNTSEILEEKDSKESLSWKVAGIVQPSLFREIWSSSTQ